MRVIFFTGWCVWTICLASFGVPLNSTDVALGWRIEAEEMWGEVNQLLIEYDVRWGDESRFLRRIVAFSGAERVSHLSQYMLDGYHRSLDPFSRSVYLDGKYWLAVQPFNRSYAKRLIEDEDIIPPVIPQDIMVLLLPRRFAEAYSWRGHRLPVFDAASADNYRVRDQVVEKMGYICLVIEEPDRDTIWLAADRGFAPILRELRTPDGGTVQRFAVEEAVEVLDRVWIPTVFRNYVYRIDEESGEEILQFAATGRTKCVS